MNPAITLNGLFLGSYGKLAEKPGLRLQEVEAQFSAAVDPHFMGSFTFSADGSGAFNIEEAYFSTLSLPRVTLRGGKFFANFGKNNSFHTHQQPLIDRPLINRVLLDEKSFNSVGLEISAVIPTPWSMEFTAAALSASSNIVTTTPFKSANSEALAGNFRLENGFDLSNVTTLGVGASYAIGNGQIQSNNVQVYGADATLKYISGKGKDDFAISWTNEFQQSSRVGYASLSSWERAQGFYSTLLFRVNQSFWVGGRMDYLQMKDTDISTVADHVMVAYVPSEFSTIRLQGGLSKTTNEDSKSSILIQYNMTLGSHPAHAY